MRWNDVERRRQMSYLYELFSNQNYDGIQMIEYFDENMLDEIDIKNNSHNTIIQSVMFLYNSDMAIPEGTENEDETHENNNNNINNININNININNNNMLSPSVMPTTPKLTESFNLN
eukprot:89502_1